MSKAFKKDDDDSEADMPVRPRPSGGKSYITPEGHRKLQEEINHLWTVERPKITQEVAAAAAQGDRSENAEYIYGKKKLREIDRRLQYLAKRVDNAIVTRPSPEQKGRVFFGAWVTIEDEEGKESTYRIVGHDEFDVKAGHISVESPLAKALLGKAEGDCAVVMRPRGPCEVTVVTVRYEGLDDG